MNLGGFRYRLTQLEDLQKSMAKIEKNSRYKTPPDGSRPSPPQAILTWYDEIAVIRYLDVSVDISLYYVVSVGKGKI